MRENRLPPPRAFAEQVKDALERLYDLPHLQHHRLVQESRLCAETSVELVGHCLRRELVAAVEALNPGEDVPFRAPHARLYNVLVLHYIERLTIQEVAHQLGVSSRQALRNLREGEKSVAEVLWARRSEPAPQALRAVELSSFQTEMARLDIRPRPTDMRLLLQRAQEVVRLQAIRWGVTFASAALPEPVILATDPSVAEQVLINTLSYVVEQAEPGDLHLLLKTGAEQVSLTLRYTAKAGAVNVPATNSTAAQLAERLGWMIKHEDQPLNVRTVTLWMKARCPTILIVEDNEGLVSLLERYLTDQSCRVVVAVNGEEGLRLAQEVLPDAIVLDVMMPEMQGWEVLQRLHSDPPTASIPVVVCSVINNPELAEALGASLFLPKPVSRLDVLNALRKLGVV